MSVRRSTRITGTWTWVLVGVALWGATAAQAEPFPKARIDAALRSGKLGRTRVAAAVVDAHTGEFLYALNADQALAPASNAKLVTSAAALHFLGADFRFRTFLYTRGVVRGDTLLGDLFVWGNGDPNISGRFHDGDAMTLPRAWAAAIAARGIREIEGDLILDDHAFDREYRHPEWDVRQLHKWYEAPVSALSFNDNCTDVHVRPGAGAGLLAKVTVVPEVGYVRLESTLSTSAKGRSKVYITREAGSRRVQVRGSVPASAKEQTYFVTVDDPPLFLGAALAEALRAQGVRLSGAVRKARAPVAVDPSTTTVLVDHASTLGDTIGVMNRRSQNLYAECVLKCLGWKQYGQGTFESGGRAVADFLDELGHPKGGYVFVDGSGLARGARVSPALICDVLRAMYCSESRDVYLASLARPGESGTLAKRMKDPLLREAVWAKTGYIRGVSALSGYVRTSSGRMLAFCILMNDLKCPLSTARAKQDEACRILAAP